jgi:hypothetical protein
VSPQPNSPRREALVDHLFVFCVISACVPPTTYLTSSSAHHPPRSRRVDDNCSPHGSKLTHITHLTQRRRTTTTTTDCVVASEASGPRTITRTALPHCARCTVRAVPCCTLLKPLTPLYHLLPTLPARRARHSCGSKQKTMSSPTNSNSSTTTIVPDAVLGPIGQPLQTLIPPPDMRSPPFIPERGHIPWMTSVLPPSHIPRGLSP